MEGSIHNIGVQLESFISNYEMEKWEVGGTHHHYILLIHWIWHDWVGEKIIDRKTVRIARPFHWNFSHSCSDEFCFTTVIHDRNS